MLFHMKTTLILNDKTVAQIKALSAERNKSLSEIVETLLRRGLEAEKELRQKRDRSPLPSFDAGECFVDLSDRNALLRVMEGR